jgi:hypothetical protein
MSAIESIGNNKVFLYGAAAALGIWLAYTVTKSVAKSAASDVKSAVKALGSVIDPTNENNAAYSAATGIVRMSTGQGIDKPGGDTLGTYIYNRLNNEAENVSAQIGNTKNTSNGPLIYTKDGWVPLGNNTGKVTVPDPVDNSVLQDMGP